MPLTIITHNSCPYTEDQIYEMGTKGINPKFKPRHRGLHTGRMAALRMADRLLAAPDRRDPKWLAEVAAERAKGL